MSTKDVKCKRCKCWRTPQDFIRRNKKWKICNMCSEWSKKSKQTNMNTEMKIDLQTTKSEQTTTLVDLWPHWKDSTNSEAVKNDTKIKYTTL